MAQRGDIQARLKLNKKAYTAGLAEALKEGKAFGAALGSAGGVKLPSVKVPGLKQANDELKEQMALARAARDAISDLRVAYERGDISRADFLRDSRAIDKELVQLRDTALTIPAAISSFNRALGTNTRGIATAEGNISKLGLSQQFLIGTNERLAQSLVGTGVLGNTAAVGIAAYGGQLGAASVGTLALGGAVLGLGVGTAALVQRGIPQVKSYQDAMNVLAASGETDLGRFRGELTAVQEQGGKTAQAFSRAQLAGALADTVKAGVSAADALELLKTGTQLAGAENEDLTESTGLVLKNLRQFNLEASEAARVGDALAQGGLLAAGSARDLSEGLATVGPVAGAAGLSIEETLGLLVNLDNKGLSAAQEGATGLRSVLSQLAGPTGPARKALNELGVTLVNVDGTLKPVKQRLFEVRDAIAASGKDLAYFSDIADTRALTSLLALNKSTDEYTQKIVNNNGALTKYGEYLSQGLEPAQARSKAALDDLGASLAEIFTPALEGAAGATERVARALDSIANSPLSVGNIVDSLLGADGEKRLQTVNADIARTKAAFAETKAALNDPKNKEVTAGQGGFHPFGLGEVDQGEVDRFIADNEQTLGLLETQLQDLQRRRDGILEQYGLGKKTGGKAGGKKDEGVALPVPEVSADYDAGVQKYLDALTSAQDSAAQAQISAMQNGAAKVEAQRQLELEQAQRAFDAQVTGLQQGSGLYNGFLAAYNTQTAAINSQANDQLQADGEAKLKTAQTLRERIEKVSTDLQDAQAKGINDPIKAITGQFQATSRSIKSETDDLLSGVQDALASGAVSAEEAQGLVAQINADARGREVRAEQEKTAAIVKVQQERKAAAVKLAEETAKAVQEVLGAQAKALSDATLASIEGTIPQLQAAFKAERDERAANFEATLTAFKGSNSERIKLVKDYNATQVLLSRQHQQDLNAQEKQGLQTYLQTLRDYQQQVAQAQQQARAQELQNAQALNSARVASAQNRVDSGDVSGYSALIAAQRDAVAVAKQLTQAERERGASTAEVVSALANEAAAQRNVVGAIQSQIDALKTLRDGQLETINSGSSVLEYARAASELSGRKLDERDAGAAIKAQTQAQLELYRAQVASNGPLAERLETLKQIQASEKELADLGQRSALTGADKTLISKDAANSLDAYPAQAATALEQIKSLDAQISQLGVTLQDATGELGTLLEAAGDGEGLSLKVAVEVDRSALDAAQQTLKEAFGEQTANKVVAQAASMGLDAGKALTRTLAQGIRDKAGILREVESLMRAIDDYFPHSNARKGALSQLTQSGKAIPLTLAKGMGLGTPGATSAASLMASRLATASRPNVAAIPTSRPLAYSSAPGGGPPAGNTFVTHIDGRSQQTSGIFAGNIKSLMNDVEREIRVRKM